MRLKARSGRSKTPPSDVESSSPPSDVESPSLSATSTQAPDKANTREASTESSKASDEARPSPSSAQSNEFIEAYYKREHTLLLTKYHAQRERLKQQELKNKALQKELDALQSKSPPPINLPSRREVSRVERTPEGNPEKNPERNPEYIHEELASYGLDTKGAIATLFELLDHPSKGPELLYSLKHDAPESLLRGFTLCCINASCEEIARPRAPLGLIISPPHLCAICQGSEGRRWYQRLLLEAKRSGRSRVLLVGGGDEDYSQIKRLNREYSGLKWTFVPGTKRVDQTSANQKVERSDVLVLWSSLHLPHALSQVFKQASNNLSIPCFSIEPGRRSVRVICQEILRAWGVPEEVLYDD